MTGGGTPAYSISKVAIKHLPVFWQQKFGILTF
jgi:hypothetical protein